MVRDGPGGNRGAGKIVPTKLFVGNLPETCHRIDLLQAFEKFGKVVECDIVKNYAFVHFEDVDEARAAVAGLHETNFNGTNIRVEMSTSKVRQKPGMGGKGECYKCGGEGHCSWECPSGSRTRGDGASRGGYGRGRPEPYMRPPPPDPYRDPYPDPYYRDRYPPPPPERYRGYPDPYERRYPPPPERRPPPPPSRDPYYRDRDPYARPPPDYYARRSPPPPRDPYAYPYYEKRPVYDDYDYFSRYRQPPPPGVDKEAPRRMMGERSPGSSLRPSPMSNYTDFTSDDIKSN